MLLLKPASEVDRKVDVSTDTGIVELSIKESTVDGLHRCLQRMPYKASSFRTTKKNLFWLIWNWMSDQNLPSTLEFSTFNSLSASSPLIVSKWMPQSVKKASLWSRRTCRLFLPNVPQRQHSMRKQNFTSRVEMNVPKYLLFTNACAWYVTIVKPSGLPIERSIISDELAKGHLHYVAADLEWSSMFRDCIGAEIWHPQVASGWRTNQLLSRSE